MHMALNVDEWMKLNTAYCKRLCVWLSGRACEINRQYSNSATGDLRCRGCNGLNDQAPPLDVMLSRSLQLALEEVLEAAALPKEQILCEDDDLGDDSDALEQDSIDEDELDAALAELMPEYEVCLQRSEICSERKTPPSKAHKVKKFAVYMGRCTRCGGYMVFAPEWQAPLRDDEVYRCYSCSWRTSPEYDWNRGNM